MNANTPGSSGSDYFYDAAPLEPHLLYQGEILVDVPVLAMPKPSRWLLLRTRSGTPLQQALNDGETPGVVQVKDSNQTEQEWDRSSNGDHVVARLARPPVLVVSQTCDIMNADFVAVAPIFGIEPAEEELAQQLREFAVFKAFYLARHDVTPILVESYADLSLIQAVHKSYFKRLTPEQHFRLSPAVCRKLQQHLTRLFGRPNSFDADADSAPETATYLCVSCFYIDGAVSSCQLDRGSEFHRCEICNGRSWVRRGR